jgi:hypothetical protein
MSAEERTRAAWLVVRSDAAWRPHGAREVLPSCGGQSLWRVDELDAETLPLDEAAYRLFEAGRVSGALLQNAFQADMKLRLSLRLRPAAEPYLHTFLRNNPFQVFADICVRDVDGDDVVYSADVLLESTAFRDARHELVTFAWRSPPDIVAQVRADVFDEDGAPKSYGGLTSGTNGARRSFVYRDPRSGEIVEAEL